jgi:hypothetical protein
MDLASGLSALKTSTDLLRSLREKLKSGEVKGEEVIGRIGEIYDYIVESKDALVEAKDEIHDLKEKLRTSEAKLRASDEFDTFKNSLTYNEQFGIWKRDVSGITEAYCSDCLNEGKSIGLTRKQSGTYACQYHGCRN